MYLTSISVSCSLVASCKQSYEFNNLKHGDRNEFNLISSLHTETIFLFIQQLERMVRNTREKES